MIVFVSGLPFKPINFVIFLTTMTLLSKTEGKEGRQFSSFKKKYFLKYFVIMNIPSFYEI